MNKFIKNKKLESQTKEIVANLYNVCKEEAQSNQIKLPLKRSFDRAALYTGLSKNTIQRIHREDETRRQENPDQSLSNPKKKHRPDIKEKIDDADFSVIRRLIQKFYLELKVVPTTRKLLIKIKEEMDFPYGRESLRKLLKGNGFYFKKCQNKRKILVERPNILHWRYKYIRSIKKFREEGRKVFYIDETWVDNDLTFKKCWQSNDVFGTIKNIGSTGRYRYVCRTKEFL